MELNPDSETKRPCACLFSFLLLLLLGQPAAGAEPPVLAFTHATVIDATGAPARPDVTVVITDDRITAIGKSSEVQPPTNAVTIDATGKFLIPGLWDMHVHWYEKDYLPLFIANGVTGVRMMWGTPLHHEWRKRVEDGSLVGPHLFIASTIVDGPKPVWPGSMTASNEAEGRQAVTKAKQDGADFVKVYSLLPRKAYFAIADEAKKQGIPFEGHLPIAVTVEEASAAGQKTVEHLTGVLAGCSSRQAELLQLAQTTLAQILTNQQSSILVSYLRQESAAAMDAYDPAKAAAVFAAFKKNQTWQCPTLTVLRIVPFGGFSALTNDARLKYMPPDMRAMWKMSQPRFTNATDLTTFAPKYFQKHLDLVGAMQRAGVGILAGTDTGNPYCFPGFGLHDELSLLVQAGLTPLQALQAATLNPARFMGREKDSGTVEPGKRADLVLLDANPLDDIANTRKIAGVIFGGRLFSRSSLDDMLARVETRARQTKISISFTLYQPLMEKDVDAAIRLYRELKSTRPADFDFSERELNNLGYQLLNLKRTKDAIRILQLNVEAYPQSANVYDSLGEAYLIAGDKVPAIENYEKSLQLYPGNVNAVEVLKRLKAP